MPFLKIVKGTEFDLILKIIRTQIYPTYFGSIIVKMDLRKLLAIFLIRYTLTVINKSIIIL